MDQSGGGCASVALADDIITLLLSHHDWLWYTHTHWDKKPCNHGNQTKDKLRWPLTSKWVGRSGLNRIWWRFLERWQNCLSLSVHHLSTAPRHNFPSRRVLTGRPASRNVGPEKPTEGVWSNQGLWFDDTRTPGRDEEETRKRRGRWGGETQSRIRTRTRTRIRTKVWIRSRTRVWFKTRMSQGESEFRSWFQVLVWFWSFL